MGRRAEEVRGPKGKKVIGKMERDAKTFISSLCNFIARSSRRDGFGSFSQMAFDREGGGGEKKLGWRGKKKGGRRVEGQTTIRGRYSARKSSYG